MRLLLVLSMAVQLVGAQSPVPRYEVKWTSAPLTVDGRLDEAAWAAAPAVTLQFLWESQTGAKQMTSAAAEFPLPAGARLAGGRCSVAATA